MVGADWQITSPQTANRSVLIETSLDLQNWTLWDVPENQPLFNATTQTRTLTGAAIEPVRFFRAWISVQ